MSKKTWADVRDGDVVTLGGNDWTVVKIKPKGKVAKVAVERGGNTAKSEVRLKDAVKLTRAEKVLRRSVPLHDAQGAQQRWATPAEHGAVVGATLPPGDASRPLKAPKKGGSWSKPADATEQRLHDVLGARVVGVSLDEEHGYVVPMLDVSTVAAHLLVFHGGIPDACETEMQMLRWHADAHSKKDAIHHVHHIHSAGRPS